MIKEMLINIAPNEERIAVLENKILEEYYIERTDTKHFAGSVYLGRVDKVIPGMGAAFVDIGKGKNGFLYISDIVDSLSLYKNAFVDEAAMANLKKKEESKERRIEDILKHGQNVLVQVVKEPIGDKGPRLSTHVAIAGRYVVLTPFEDTVGISKRIEDVAERDRLRRILKEIGVPRDGMGCIVRTDAWHKGAKELRRELDYLTKLWQRIRYRSNITRPPACLYEEYSLILRVVRDLFTDDTTALIIDSKLGFKRISQFLNTFNPALRRKVHLYRERNPLFEKYGIESQVESIFNKRVPLKSGGSIIIEQTESLIAIDVNTGRYVGRKDLEETVFRTNMEAAKEIPRQLRLRDLGGIIIIDFIDMEYKDHKKTVFETLKENLKRDKARTNILNISQIGVVEMTRQRVRKSLESVSYQSCPYCEGRGLVKSPATVTVEAMRKLEKFTSEKPHHRFQAINVTLTVHPDVYEYIKTRHKDLLYPLERKLRIRVGVKSNPSLHIEDIAIE